MFWIIRNIKKVYKMADPEDRRLVLENAFSLSTLQGMSYILPVIILPYLIRVLGPGKFGLIAFAQAFNQYFMILVDYGFSVSATRQIALHKGSKEEMSAIFSSVLAVRLILLGASLLILLAVLGLVSRFQQERLVYLFAFPAVAGTALFPVWYFMGTEKMKYIFRLNTLSGILYLAGIFTLVKGPQDYLKVPLINSCAFLLAGGIGLYVAIAKFRISFILPTLKEIIARFKSGWHVFSSILAINAYTVSRIFAVGLLTNNIITGYYSIAENIANAIQTFPLVSFAQAIYPRLNKIFHKNKRKAFDFMRKIQHVAANGFVFSLPVVFLLSPLIIRLVCGEEFKEAVLALRLLLVPVFIVGSNAFRIQFLLVCGKERLYSRIHLAAASLGLPLVFILIYYFSYIGAGLATAIIEAGVLIITVRVVGKLSFNNR